MKRIATYILLSWLLLSGCIREERNRCDVSNVALSLVYFGDGVKDIFSKVANKVDAFVYDESGDFVIKKELDKSAIETNKEFLMDLVPGDYTVILWANAMSNTIIMNSYNLNEASVGNPAYYFGGEIKSNDKLYYGKCQISVPKTGRVMASVAFVSAHISIEMYISGEGVTDQSIPAIEIDNLFPQYDFFMNKIYGRNINNYQKTKYYPESKYDAVRGMSVSKTDVLTFEQQNDIVIFINEYDSNNPITSLNLAKFLKDNNIDVENRQERRIPIQVSLNKDLSVDITIPSWETPDVTPEI